MLNLVLVQKIKQCQFFFKRPDAIAYIVETDKPIPTNDKVIRPL